MRKLSIVTLLGIAVLVLFKLGCSDISSSGSRPKIDGIKSVIPARGGYGARVVIGGYGFDPLQKITFNGIEAVAESVSDSVIVTRVPMDATTGPIELIAKGETLTGPVFTVDTTTTLFLNITAVNPQKAHQLDTVKITGTGFGGVTIPQKTNASYQEESIISDKLERGSNELIKANPRDALLGKPEGRITPMVEQRSITQPTSSHSANDDLAVYFNEIEGTILSRSDTVMIATVPLGAQTGLISVVSAADTVLGPNFQVLNQSISKISPTTGVAGTEVTITGTDFSSKLNKNIVTFNGKVATVQSASEIELVVIVPNDASTGEVAVTINTIEKKGPIFTVQEEAIVPEIYSISPDTGYVGLEVTISGKNFGAEPSDNDVWFSGSSTDVQGIVKSASTTELLVEVPYGVETGPISVVVNNQAVQGPVFTVVEGPKKLVVNIITNNASPGHDGYNLQVSGQTDRWVHPNSPEVYEGITDSQVIIELSEGPMGCVVVGDNPRTVSLGSGTTEVDFIFNCVPEITNLAPDSAQVGDTVTVSGNNFNYDSAKNKFYFNGGSTPIEATIVESSRWELKVIVPSGTVTGAVSVTSDGVSATGPEFTLLEAPQKLNVNISSINASSGHDGYNLKVSGQTDRWVSPNGTVTYENLTDSQVIIELEQGPQSCEIQGQNPRTVSLSPGTTEVDYLINCFPSINNITPDSAQVGDTVKVNGSGFNYDASQNKFYFSSAAGEVEATIVESSQWNLEVIVPSGAITGPVRVSSMGLSKNGPEFTVLETPKSLRVHVETIGGPSGHDGYNLSVSGQDDEWIAPSVVKTFTGFTSDQITVELSDGPPLCMTGIAEANPQQITLSGPMTDVYFTITCESPSPEIYSITPDNGTVGTVITISGENFSEVPSENKVWFAEDVLGSSGVQGTVTSSTSTEIIVEVPEGASTGSISVEVNGKWAESPTFTVVEAPKILKIYVETINSYPGHDGYNLSVTGETDRWIAPTTTETYTDLSSNQLSIELSDGPPQCMVNIAEGNPQQITLTSGTNDVYFTVECAPEPEIFYYDPTTGAIGSETTIIGANFSTNIEENVIWFNGADNPATIIGGTDNKLLVEIPEGATTGPVSIELYWYYVTGPDFEVVDNLSDKVVFSAATSVGNRIFKMDPYSSTSSLTQLSTGAGDHLEPAISPDGNFVAYSQMASNGSSKIHLIDKEGSQETVFDAGKHSVRPSWSPDGTKIVFSSGDYAGSVDLYVYDLQAASSTMISNTHSSVNQYPSWSSNNKIIYVTYDDNNSLYKLKSINPNGSSNVTLLQSFNPFYDMKWSPNGNEFAYTALDSNSNMRIHISKANGSNVQLMKSWGIGERYPSWSPDGDRIIYSVDESGQHSLYFFDLSVQDGASVLLTGDNIQASWGAN
ncbi:MAG: IPT/TIG domain-containing protein [Balneolaceae bacterium]